MRNVVDFLTGNLILNVSIIAWAAAQIIKFFVVLLTERRVDWPMILSSGGMPSSHSSTVCAMAAAVAYLYGFQSALFAISAVLAIVVMYDASHVRRQTGDQAKVLNYIMQNWPEMKPEEFDKNLRELMGHTHLQVLMGAGLGILIGWFGAILWSR